MTEQPAGCSANVDLTAVQQTCEWKKPDSTAARATQRTLRGLGQGCDVIERVWHVMLRSNQSSDQFHPLNNAI